MKGVYARANAEQIAARRRVLEGLQTAPLEAKVEIASRVIEQALKIGRPALLYSGGKDSTVLLHLVTRQAPDLLTIYNDTTLSDPRLKTWMAPFIYSNFPEIDFRQTTAEDPIAMWQKRGHYPIMSKRGHTIYKKRDPQLRISPVQCCYQLKEKYANTILGTEEIQVVFWGNRAAESARRLMTFLDNGYLFKPKKYAWHQAYPIQHFTDQDVADYLKRHVPEYPAGRKAFETGCLPCATNITFWPNNLSKLYQEDRGAWEKYMRAGFAEQIMRIKGIPGSPEEIITTRPELLLHIETRSLNRDSRKED
jgi:3'-phosphoadenosine 5'-phosphosulfate sulfotransferase (PAPS reductase)/FAD synthetase